MYSNSKKSLSIINSFRDKLTAPAILEKFYKKDNVIDFYNYDSDCKYYGKNYFHDDNY